MENFDSTASSSTNDCDMDTNPEVDSSSPNSSSSQEPDSTMAESKVVLNEQNPESLATEASLDENRENVTSSESMSGRSEVETESKQEEQLSRTSETLSTMASGTVEPVIDVAEESEAMAVDTDDKATIEQPEKILLNVSHAESPQKLSASSSSEGSSEVSVVTQSEALSELDFGLRSIFEPRPSKEELSSHCLQRTREREMVTKSLIPFSRKVQEFYEQKMHSVNFRFIFERLLQHPVLVMQMFRYLSEDSRGTVMEILRDLRGHYRTITINKEALIALFQDMRAKCNLILFDRQLRLEHPRRKCLSYTNVGSAVQRLERVSRLSSRRIQSRSEPSLQLSCQSRFLSTFVSKTQLQSSSIVDLDTRLQEVFRSRPVQLTRRFDRVPEMAAIDEYNAMLKHLIYVIQDHMARRDDEQMAFEIGFSMRGLRRSSKSREDTRSPSASESGEDVGSPSASESGEDVGSPSASESDVSSSAWGSNGSESSRPFSPESNEPSNKDEFSTSEGSALSSPESRGLAKPN